MHGYYHKEVDTRMHECGIRGLCEQDSRYRASIKFIIPRMTLSDRALNKVPLASVKEHPMHLTQEKISLKHYIMFMGDRGFPISREEVLYYPWCKRPENERYFGDKGPSLMWWRVQKAEPSQMGARLSTTTMLT